MKEKERILWASVKGKFFLRIEVVGNEKLLEMFDGDYIRSTIPCYTLLTKKPLREEGVFRLEITDTDNSAAFDMVNNKICIRATNERLFAGDVIFMMFLLFAKIMQEKGYFIIHGSSIAKDGKAILLVGPSESGKTTVSLRLCLENGFSVLSTDMTILKVVGDQLIVVGGTKECSMFPGIIKSEFDGKMSELLINYSGDLWSKKIDVRESDLRNLGIKYEEDIPLKSIYYLRVQNSAFFPKSFDNAACKIKALGIISEWIRGANNMVISANTLVPSLDTPKSEGERIKALDAISKSVHQCSLYGNLKEVVSYINSSNQ